MSFGLQSSAGSGQRLLFISAGRDTSFVDHDIDRVSIRFYVEVLVLQGKDDSPSRLVGEIPDRIRKSTARHGLPGSLSPRQWPVANPVPSGVGALPELVEHNDDPVSCGDAEGTANANQAAVSRLPTSGSRRSVVHSAAEHHARDLPAVLEAVFSEHRRDAAPANR